LTPTTYRPEHRQVELVASRNIPHSEAKYRNQQPEFLLFTSPVASPYPENNLANARWFPAEKKTGERMRSAGPRDADARAQRAPGAAQPSEKRRAVVVLPHWNSDAISHNALCRAFNWFGISALRLSMPYHDI